MANVLNALLALFFSGPPEPDPIAKLIQTHAGRIRGIIMENGLCSVAQARGAIWRRVDDIIHHRLEIRDTEKSEDDRQGDRVLDEWHQE